ncbi:MAG: polysaccharide deacetylase family protein [Dehalococcoidales bacterium]|nr:polysaccharide deacetylase family protein [Dehalococcoidales bacterium]
MRSRAVLAIVLTSLLLAGCAAGLEAVRRTADVTSEVTAQWPANITADFNANRVPSPGGATPFTAPGQGAPSPNPGPTPTTVLATSTKAPVLMYHYIRVNPDPSDKIGAGLSVTPADFEAQMAFLAQRGYATTLVHDLVDRSAWPAQTVAITFDDGYADAFEVAYPILRRYGFKATFYVIVDFVGRPGYMTWDQLRMLAADGNAIGSHSLSHPDLRTLGGDELRRQLVDSRVRLERELGMPVSDFCYPAGLFDDAVLAAARGAGYRAAVTTKITWFTAGSDRLSVSRVRVAGGTSLADFAAMLDENL